jgi:hypothetical protein
VSDLRRFGRGERSVAITSASGILHQPHSRRTTARCVMSPLGPFGERIGDQVPLFELVLPPRAARLAVPLLGGVTALGVGVVAARSRAGHVGGAHTLRSCRDTLDSNVQRWEYMPFDLVKRKAEIEGPNRLGREGWEAVAMVSSWGVGWRFVHPIVLLKRPRPNEAEGSPR